jgi:glycosyltransferase involved in cell wall biosynthesis
VPAAWLAGVRHILRTRNNLGYWMTPLHRLLTRACDLFAHGVVANCEPCRQKVIQEEGVPPALVHVLENGVDLSRFSVASAAKGQATLGHQRRVGITANLRGVKDLDLLIRAAAEVRTSHPDVVFQIAGDGECRPQLERLIAELGLRGCVYLLGYVADIPGFLRELDVAVLCSRSEGMANAVLEYMAAGKAIVATAVGANVQLIVDQVHGVLVPPGDLAQLVSAIRRLLGDASLRERLGNAARMRVSRLYSREAMVRRYEQFYQRLVGRVPSAC